MQFIHWMNGSLLDFQGIQRITAFFITTPKLTFVTKTLKRKTI